MGNRGSTTAREESGNDISCHNYSKCSTEDRMRATIYGNCIGDAIGLATEFMVPANVKTYYGKVKHFEYKDIVRDFHRERWAEGDWTDDSDQMLLILMSLLEKEGKIDHLDFAAKMVGWRKHGFPDLGDVGGMGIGATTAGVLNHRNFLTEPHVVAEGIWEAGLRRAAPNGGVMRTSVLGIHEYWDLEKVIENTLAMCAVTHADPRCKASCVAVTTCIALMLQGQEKHLSDGKLNIAVIMEESYEHAKKCLTDESHISELRKHMFTRSISQLELAEPRKIGYTYKTMGAGFWALRQSDFRTAIEVIVRETGDADTNGAVAGALLGCKLGPKALPDSWVDGLKHKVWLDEKLDRFINMVKQMAPVTEDIKGSTETEDS